MRDNPLKRQLNFKKSSPQKEVDEEIEFTKNLLFTKDDNLIGEHNPKYLSRRDENKRKNLELKNQRDQRSHSNVKISFNSGKEKSDFSQSRRKNPTKRPPVVTNKITLSKDKLVKRGYQSQERNNFSKTGDAFLGREFDNNGNNEKKFFNESGYQSKKITFFLIFLGVQNIKNPLSSVRIINSLNVSQANGFHETGFTSHQSNTQKVSNPLTSKSTQNFLRNNNYNQNLEKSKFETPLLNNQSSSKKREILDQFDDRLENNRKLIGNFNDERDTIDYNNYKNSPIESPIKSSIDKIRKSSDRKKRQEGTFEKSMKEIFSNNNDFEEEQEKKGKGRFTFMERDSLNPWQKEFEPSSNLVSSQINKFEFKEEFEAFPSKFNNQIEIKNENEENSGDFEFDSDEEYEKFQKQAQDLMESNKQFFQEKIKIEESSLVEQVEIKNEFFKSNYDKKSDFEFGYKTTGNLNGDNEASLKPLRIELNLCKETIKELEDKNETLITSLSKLREESKKLKQENITLNSRNKLLTDQLTTLRNNQKNFDVVKTRLETKLEDLVNLNY